MGTLGSPPCHRRAEGGLEVPTQSVPNHKGMFLSEPKQKIAENFLLPALLSTCPTCLPPLVLTAWRGTNADMLTTYFPHLHPFLIVHPLSSSSS